MALSLDAAAPKERKAMAFTLTATVVSVFLDPEVAIVFCLLTEPLLLVAAGRRSCSLTCAVATTFLNLTGSPSTTARRKTNQNKYQKTSKQKRY